MKAPYILDKLESIGVKLSIGENENLHVNAPRGFKETPEYEQLIQRRDEIKEYLNYEIDKQSELIINKLELRDDRSFVIKQLHGIFGYQRLAIVSDYVRIWQLAAKAEPSPIKKENTGRRQANTWLRKRHESDVIF